MTTAEIARIFKARRSGSYRGRRAYQGKCCLHDDRMASLSVTEPERGRSKVNCFAGCDDLDLLSSKGLTVSDLYADKREITPEIIKRWSDEERLELLERQYGLAIMARVVLTTERNYWRVVEQNVFEQMHDLRDTLYPEEKAQREQAAEVQRIIAAYGFEELWECLKV